MEAQTAKKLLFRSILLVLLISFIHSEKLVDPMNVKNSYENPNILLNADNEVGLEQTTEGNQNMIFEDSNIAMAKPEEITESKGHFELRNFQNDPRYHIYKKERTTQGAVKSTFMHSRLLAAIANCTTYSSSNPNICSVCADGFTVNSQGTCTACSVNCIKCTINPTTSITECTQCRPVTLNQTTGVYPYVLYNKVCVSQIPYGTEYLMLQLTSTTAKFVRCPSYCYSCILNDGTFLCLVTQGGFGITNLDFSNLWPCKDNCNVCYFMDGMSGKSCLTCNSGAYKSGAGCATCLDSSAGSCFACNMPVSTLNCTSCAVNYFLQGTSCSSCSQNCANCASSSVCSKCMLGYRLYTASTTSAYCVPCPQNCTSCGYLAGTTAVCTSCFYGYYIDASTYKCNPCPAGCAICSSPNVCTTCFDGYILLSVPKCVPKVENCMMYIIDTGKCSDCAANYALFNNICTYSPIPIADKFYACNQTQSLQNYACKNFSPLIENCTEYNRDYCTKCKSGMVPDYVTGTWTQICSVCPITGCAECRTKNLCTKCNPGFFLDTTTKFFQCGKCLDGCATCILRAEYCLTCQSGFYMTQSMKCVSYKKFSFSIELGSPFSAIDSILNPVRSAIQTLVYPSAANLTPLLKKQYFSFTNIKTGVLSATTNTLIEGYISLPNAQTIQTSYTAFTNAVKVSSSLAGLIIKSVTISALQLCPIGQKYDSATGNCLSFTISNCLTYDALTNNLTCKTCASGWTLKAGNTICSANCAGLANCDACLSTSACQVCLSNFVKVNGKCYAQITNCLAYSSTDGKCTSCATNFRVSNDGLSCQAVISNCQTYSAAGLCTACNAATLRVSNNGLSCQTVITNCATYTADGKCATCNAATLRVSNDALSCQSVITNCSTYANDGKCTTCNAASLRVSNNGLACQTVIASCATYTADGKCSTCSTSYQLSGDSLSCKSGTTIANCLSYTNDNKCKTCATNFRVSNDALSCQSVITNCNTYSADGLCSYCKV